MKRPRSRTVIHYYVEVSRPDVDPRAVGLAKPNDPLFPPIHRLFAAKEFGQIGYYIAQLLEVGYTDYALHIIGDMVITWKVD